SPLTPTTDATGTACTTLSAGSMAQALTVTAKITTVSATPQVTFSETVTAGNATKIVKSAGDAQSAPVNSAVTNALQVTVTDTDGNLVTGTPVTFTAVGGGTVSAGAGNATSQIVNTNASGVASVSWTLGGAIQGQTVTAASGSLTNSPLTFTVTVLLPNSTTITQDAGKAVQRAQERTTFATNICAVVMNNGSAVVGAT